MGACPKELEKKIGDALKLSFDEMLNNLTELDIEGAEDG